MNNFFRKILLFSNLNKKKNKTLVEETFKKRKFVHLLNKIRVTTFFKL